MELAAGEPFNTRDREVGDRLSCLASSFRLMGFSDRTWVGCSGSGFFVLTSGVSHVFPEKTIQAGGTETPLTCGAVS